LLRRILDSPWLYFGLAALLVVGSAAYYLGGWERPLRPLGTPADLASLAERDDVNVLFVLIDTLRADHLSAYGYERETSPMLDYLAGSGVLFSHVQAQSSWTKASMASLWTGGYPSRIGVTRYGHGLSPDLVTAAERFQQAGFATGGVFRNGWVEGNFGFGQGFDTYVRPAVSATPERFKRQGPPSVHPLEGTDRDATDAAMEFLRAHGHQRFFLYVHYMDVHQYLYASELAQFGTTWMDSYDNAIRWTDRNIEALVATLAEQGLLEKTLIVVASDHGEAFGEHGREGHARNLYREETETPLIFSLPFGLEPGIVVEATVQNVDLWPTVLDLLGLPGLPELDGRSARPLLLEAAGLPSEGTEALRERAAFAEIDRRWGQASQDSQPMVAIVEGDLRYIHQTAQPDADELYDRGRDPAEQQNIADEQPERAAALRALAEAHLARGAEVDAPHVELDEMRKAQLRALGYVDLR
jgi:arylsulfatase A-like enzyme